MTYKLKHILENLYFSALWIVVLLMPFSNNIISWFIIAASALFVFGGDLLLKAKRIKQNPYALVLILLFLCFVMSMFSSTNQVEGIKALERKIAYFVFPVLIAGTVWQQAQIKRLALVFVTSVCVASLYCLIVATSKYYNTQDSNVFIYHEFSQNINIGAVYLALYVLLSIHLLLYFKENINRFLLWTTLVFLGIVLLLLNSKMMLFLFALSILVYIFYHLKSKGKVISTLLVLLGLSLSLIFIPHIKKRVQNEFKSDFSVLHKTQFKYNEPFTGTSLRLVLWKIAINELKAQNAWLLGLGIGDLHLSLDKKYKEMGLYLGNPELGDTGYQGYGPHNQFIEILLAIGIIGLLVFLTSIYIYFKTAIQSKNYLALQFGIIFVCFFMTESVLSTAKGIVCFAFFSLLLLNIKTRKPNSVY